MVDEYKAPPPLKMRPQKENFSTDLEYFLQADLSREEFFNICKKDSLDQPYSNPGVRRYFDKMNMGIKQPVNNFRRTPSIIFNLFT